MENPFAIPSSSLHGQASDVSSGDIKETLKLLKEIPQLSCNISETVKNISRRIQNDELPTTKGISFLDLKNYTFLNYIMNLNYIIMQKLSGKKIENDPAIERLIEERIVLERMKPIDEKLKYQIDKLQSAIGHGQFDESNPLQFRANPENLNEEESEMPDTEFNSPKSYLDEDCLTKGHKKKDSSKALGIKNDGEISQEKRSNVYIPPKITAAYFDEDTLEERKKKILQRSKKRALSSSVLQELKREYDTGPEEIKETVDPYKVKLNEDLKGRQRYEEEYMTRLPMTKKYRHETRQLTTVSNFDMRLGDISALDMNTDDVSLKRRSSGKKGKFSRNSGVKKGKKRKR